MLSLLTILALHIPPEDYLRCEDFDWLTNGLANVDFFTPSEKLDILTNWMDHTDPTCFDNEDAND
jgi:hypothetical protein